MRSSSALSGGFILSFFPSQYPYNLVASSHALQALELMQVQRNPKLLLAGASLGKRSSNCLTASKRKLCLLFLLQLTHPIYRINPPILPVRTSRRWCGVKAPPDCKRIRASHDAYKGQRALRWASVH